MAYQSLYLKYRPQTFDEVIGQDHICRTLRNALREGKVAHAYLLCGPRGTGKTTSARILAKALSCEKGVTDSPCGVCEACVAIRDGRLLDVVEIDAASNTGVDNIRELKEVLGYVPTWGRFRIYIIDEVHMLSTAAWNALLKTLEEPPDYAYFIMATTDPQKVLPTILSRCQRFDFRRVAQPVLVEHLRAIAEKEAVEVDDAALWAIAGLSEGCVRDAITMFDQIGAYAQAGVTVDDVNAVLGTLNQEAMFALADVIATGDAAAAFKLVDDLAQEGKDFSQIIHALTRHVRNLLLVKSGCASVSALEVDEATIRRLGDQAKRFTMPMLMQALSCLSDAREDLKWNHQHRLVLEIALVAMMARPGPAVAPPTRDAEPVAVSPAPTPLTPADDVDEALAELPSGPSADDAETMELPTRATPDWQRAVIRIAGVDGLLGQLLNSSAAEFRGENELIVLTGSFAANMLKEKLKSPDSGPQIRAVLEDVYGSEVKVTVRVAAANGDRPEQAGSAAAMVLDMFEGSSEL